MKRFILASLVLAFSSQQALGADGSSGCGPAWYILKENSLLSSVGRFVTNMALFPLTTLGMVLGTSNCAKHKIVDAHQRSLHFATVNIEQLQLDAARGAGDYAQAYAATFGCSGLAGLAFDQSLQQNYAAIFADASNIDSVVYKTRAMIEHDPALRTWCAAS